MIGRIEQAKRFFNTVRTEVINTGNQIHITLVYFQKEKDFEMFNEVKAAFEALKADSVLMGNGIEGSLLTPSGQFSRGRGLQIGADSRPADSLLFMVDIDMVFKADLLIKIAENTRPQQAYMPIVFSQYEFRDDQTDNSVITTTQGFWRSYGFGMISIYKRDLKASGGYNMNIEGWGMEDVELCDALIKERLTKHY